MVGPQQDANATATLRTACDAAESPSFPQPGFLQVMVNDDRDFTGLPDTDFTVMIATVDGQTPEMPRTMPTTASVLAVSPGAATADQLARVAVSAAIDGREIAGILVADPEPDDHTTGQIPELARPVRRTSPTRVNGNGLTAEIRR